MTEKEERLLNAYEEASQMLENIGIETKEITELQVNTRAKSRWGQCIYNWATDTCKITISEQLLEKNIKKEALFNTLMHELLHACGIEYLNHGVEWKRLADIVNKTYGLNIKAATSAAEKGVSQRPAKYIIRCPECGMIYRRNKYCSVVKRPHTFICGKCRHKGLELV